MGTIISILIVIVCILLILVVLVQNSKGGGLASSFASSNQVMGVRKTADFLEKTTWTLAISLLALSLISTAYNKPVEGATNAAGTESVTRKKAEESRTPAPTAAPAPIAPIVDPNATQAPPAEPK
ncbi:MAG: preprotein translocase subunit SecG [Bacteroidetes bacterium]|nr:preprotein translocase subunit SecG [Bacteroidota bacterium]